MISTGVSAAVIDEYTTLISDMGISSVWTVQVVDQIVIKDTLMSNSFVTYILYNIIRERIHSVANFFI